MDRHYIENEQIVERYLSGDLTVREAREFQRFCAAHPELLDEWPIPAALRAQLIPTPAGTPQTEADLRTEDDGSADTQTVYGERRRNVEDPSIKGTMHWRRLATRWLPVLGIALLAAVVGVITLGVQTRNLKGQVKTMTRQVETLGLRAHSSVQTHRIKLVRGRPQQPTLALGWRTPPELLDLYIDVTEGNYSSFQVTIDRLDGTRVLQIRRIARDSNRELRLALNSSAFGPGDYLMKFDGYTWRGQTQELGWILLGLQ